MSKKSRGFDPGRQRTAGDAASSEATAGEPAAEVTGGPAAASSRAAARRGSRDRKGSGANAGSGVERYRGVLLAAVAVVGVGAVAIFLFQGASAAPYVCDSLLTPPPAVAAASEAAGPAAEPAPTPQVGFVTSDLGRDHVPNGSTVRYAFCPPTSGDHWNVAGRAPLRRAVYGPGDAVSPGNWVHNLEHGYVVVAYREEPEAGDMSGIREVFERAAPGPVAQQCGLPNKVIAVPFEDMAEPFAILAWDRALLMPTWDTEVALAFANQWQESLQHPEPAC